MDLKTKYQYTYFIYPYVIKENRYIRYLMKLLRDKNCSPSWNLYSVYFTLTNYFHYLFFFIREYI